MFRSQPARLVSLLIDQTCIALALATGGLWSSWAHRSEVQSLAAIAATHLAFGLIWAVATGRLGLYQVPLLRNRRQALRVLLETWFITWGAAGLTTISLLEAPSFAPWIVLAVGFAGMAGTRLLLARTALAAGSGRPRTIIVGACPNAQLLSSGKDVDANMEVLGFVPLADEDSASMSHLQQLGTAADIPSLINAHSPDLVLVSPSDRTPARELGELFRTCDRLGITINYFPTFLQVQHMQVGMTWNSDQVGLALRTHYNRSISRLAKRSLDFVGASIGMLLLLPVFVFCALAVKLTSRGPVFYRQTRVGQNGQHFSCFKFRTMRVGADAIREKFRAASIQDGPAFKIPDDPRITSAGRFLRKFSLDELPQLINVLVGDMSLVGPRPPIPSEVEQYTWWQRRRIMVKPGLTCVWQVWGRNRVSFKRWVEMDIYYIDNWSLWMDIKLIAHTFRVVLRGTGM